MGIIKAAIGAIGGGFADSWLEVIEPGEMDDKTVMVSGVKIRPKDRRSSNKRLTDNTVSNGSVIHVYPNQMMIMLDNGRIVDYSAEEGFYEVYLSSMPSMFNGELRDSVKETFSRIKFGGTPSSAQKVYFINLQEIKGIRFGTRTALNYFDNFYNSELFLRAHGNYSIKITDPLKFFTEAVPRNAQRVSIDDINEQYLAEFTNALKAAISQMSVDGIRISMLNSKSLELAKYMAKCLDEEWKDLRGMEICSVGIDISYDEESQKLINIRNKGAMLSDATIREGYVQGAVAGGLEAAGSNTAGAAQAFMGMGMGMQSAGNFMGAASASNQAQMQQAQKANGWTCSCGKVNEGNFCSGCGKSKPSPADSWKCSCGAVNTGKFCTECGSPRPSDGKWKCSCGAENVGNFCMNCGAKKQ